MAWVRRRYRGHKAWVLVDDAGEAVCDDRGLAALRYRPDDVKTYSVQRAEIRGLEERDPPSPPPADCIEVWVRTAEGARTGLGVVLAWRGHSREIARATPDLPPARARRWGVRTALEAIRRPSLPVRVHAGDAQELERTRRRGPAEAVDRSLARLAEAMRRFADLRFCGATETPSSPPDRRAAELARHTAGLGEAPSR